MKKFIVLILSISVFAAATIFSFAVDDLGPMCLQPEVKLIDIELGEIEKAH